MENQGKETKTNTNTESSDTRKRSYAQLFTPGRAPRKMLPEKQRRYHHFVATKRVAEAGTQSYGSYSDAQTQTYTKATETNTASTQTSSRESLSRKCKK